MSYRFHPLTPASKDGKQAQPGLVALADALEELYPKQSNWGIYNYRTVSGSSSLSHHAEGRAYDVGVGADKALGDAICSVLLENAFELGLDHVIWYGRKWSAKYPDGAAYNGSNPTLRHEDHIHVGMHWDFAKTMTKDKILKIIGDDTAMALTKHEEEQVKLFVKALDEVGSNGTFVRWLIPDIRKGIITVDELDAALKNVKAGTTVDQFARDLAKQANDKLAKIKGVL